MYKKRYTLEETTERPASAVKKKICKNQIVARTPETPPDDEAQSDDSAEYAEKVGNVKCRKSLCRRESSAVGRVPIEKNRAANY